MLFCVSVCFVCDLRVLCLLVAVLFGVCVVLLYVFLVLVCVIVCVVCTVRVFCLLFAVECMFRLLGSNCFFLVCCVSSVRNVFGFCLWCAACVGLRLLVLLLVLLCVLFVICLAYRCCVLFALLFFQHVFCCVWVLLCSCV